MDRVKQYQFNYTLAAEKQMFLERQHQELQVFMANQEARKQAFLKTLGSTTANSSNKCEYVALPPIQLEKQREEELKTKNPLPLPKPRVSNTLKSLQNNISFHKYRDSVQKAKKRLDAKTKLWNKK